MYDFAAQFIPTTFLQLLNIVLWMLYES